MTEVDADVDMSQNHSSGSTPVTRILAGVTALYRRDTTALMLANLGAAVVGVATGVVAARALGAGGRGDLAVIVFWPSLIATIVDLGIADAVTLRCAREPSSARKYYTNAMRLAWLAGAGGVAIGVGLIPVLLRADQALLRADAMAALAYVPLSALAAVPVAALLGLGKFRAVAAIRFGTAIAYTASMLIAVATGNGTVRCLMWLTVAARGAPFLLALPLMRRALRVPGDKPNAAVGFSDQARDGARLHSAKLATVMAASEDRALASWTLTQAGIGYWQVASALAVVMQFVSQAVSQHLYSTAAGTKADRSELVFGAYVRSVGLTGLVAIAALPLLPLVVPLLYGDEFKAAVPAAAIVMTAAAVAAAGATLQAAAKAMLATRLCVVAEVIGMSVMAIVAYGLVRVMGTAGLAVGYLAGRLTVAISMSLGVRTLFAVAPLSLVPGSRRFRSVMRAQLQDLIREAR